MGAHYQVGVDVQQPLGRHLHLQLAHRGMGGKNLTVDIGDGNGVAVDQIDGADAAAGQGLRRVTAHAADAENGHPGVLHPLHGVRTQ